MNQYDDGFEEALVFIGAGLDYLSKKIHQLSSLEVEDNADISDRFKSHLNAIAIMQKDISNLKKHLSTNISDHVKINQITEKEEGFRETIVSVMILCLQCWEQSTYKDKIALAEESKLWTIYKVGGQLSTKIMDQYLSINTLPKYPRCSSVVRTAYFVIKKSPDQSEIKKRLENTLNHLQDLLHEEALTKREDPKNSPLKKIQTI